jgi:hypothetical protein
MFASSSQEVQLKDPGMDTVPPEHTLQVPVPVAILYLPALHSVHDLDPALDVYFPAAQFKHGE